MKKVILLLSLVSTIFISCENKDLEKLYTDKVIFLKNNRVQVSGFLSNDKIELDIPIYRSGIADGKVEVSVELNPSLLTGQINSEGETLTVLPQDSYVLSDYTVYFEGENRSAILKLTVDVSKLSGLQGVMDDNYAIPLMLKTNGVLQEEDNSKLIVVPVLTGGIRPGSAEVLWSKSFTELGINNTDNNTASFAVTSKYVYVNTRNVDLRYYDRFTGEYKGSVALPFKGNLTNFTVTNDEHDNLLITNLRNEAVGVMGEQKIYILRDGGAPQEFIKYSHTYQSGRKLSVVGNLKGNALITATAQNSSIIHVWRVENGLVQSQTPEILTMDESQILWGNLADAIPVSLDLNDGLFVVGAAGTKPNFGYFKANGELQGAFNINDLGLPSTGTNYIQSLALAHFNGSRYLALAAQNGQSMMSLLIDITKTKGIGVVPTSSYISYTAPVMTTVANGNSTADIHLRVSDDEKSLVMYSLGTHGTITATKFTD